MRKINKLGLDLIKHYEGYVSHAYFCPANYLTIGYGHLCRNGDFYLNGIRMEHMSFPETITITKEEAEQLLLSDLTEAENAVERLINIPLSDNQFSALVSFTFNLGSGALQRSTLRRKLNRSEYINASNEFHKWVWAGGKKLRGLVNRRHDEKALFMLEVW